MCPRASEGEGRVKKEIAIIEAAVSCGSPTRGTEFAYDALMEGGLGNIFPGSRGIPMEKLPPCESYPPHLKYLDTVMAVSRRLRENLLAVLGEGNFPIVIGGDHSIAMGSLAALGEFYGAEELAVVYIDAHADINTEKSSASACIHGMDLAAACGLCCDELTVGKNKVNLLGRDLHIVGGRSIDPPEWEIMERLGVNFYSAQAVRAGGVEQALADILPALRGKKVHISFDVDSLDPEEFTATGYVLPGGLTFAQVEQIVRAVAAESRLVSFECVEYNPTRDPGKKDRAKLLHFFRALRGILEENGI